MYGDTITLVQLSYLRAAADLGSFSKAASSLGVTQPALSNGIAVLERSIGGELFHRSRTGVVLSPLGIRTLPHFLQILGSIERVAVEVRNAALTATALRVGVSPLIHPGMIARALEVASHNHWGPLVLREDNMAGLRTSLIDRELDLILVPAVPGIGRFAHRALEDEPLHYLASPVDTLANQTWIELSDVAQRPLVLVGDTCGLTTFTRALCADLNPPLESYAGEADSYTTLQEWAALGLGGVLLPRSKFAPGAVTRAVLRDGVPVVLSYEAVWDSRSARESEIAALLDEML